MPRPVSERQAWEHELREELPARLAEYQRELDAAPGCDAGAPGVAHVADEAGAEADGYDSGEVD